MVSTHLKNISQNGNLPQIGFKIKYLKPPPREPSPHMIFFKRSAFFRPVISFCGKPQTFSPITEFFFSILSAGKHHGAPAFSSKIICIYIYTYTHKYIYICKISIYPSQKCTKKRSGMQKKFHQIYDKKRRWISLKKLYLSEAQISRIMWF